MHVRMFLDPIERIEVPRYRPVKILCKVLERSWIRTRIDDTLIDTEIYSAPSHCIEVEHCCCFVCLQRAAVHREVPSMISLTTVKSNETTSGKDLSSSQQPTSKCCDAGGQPGTMNAHIFS